ncbi:hypothetical protein NAT47_05995 [Flavobacterium sp. HXWNR69]|uniref:DUF4261 domain-containing protein n=1 Tax=Flavobacterium fragile TaxID=2949085 RepID=A0ABT0TG52_9FLAO|nr:hypothetical protein [Flavobacterium sp. HXWNR69]MCL9769961.1 hypothetical protein [Flavobacterium sp. HXWNR69]
MKTITNFWNYFQQNNFVFLLLNEISKDELKLHFDKLIEILHQYNKDLDLIIKNKKNGAELIITANGNPYLFKEVELLVHHALVVERWKITAFLQPETNLTKYEKSTDKPLEYYGITLRISEMYFIPLENPNKPTDLGIKVLLKNYIVHKDNPRLREAVYIHIEHLIGEKSFANDIAFIEIGQWEGDNENQIELYNLKSYIDIEKEQLSFGNKYNLLPKLN